MEKAIDIKRRAQRYVQSGDIDAALGEYEKLAQAEENEPYHSVVIADLLFKKGAPTDAAQRYLIAIDGYERTGLYKNGIAVCKKMARLNLAPLGVLERLARLHELDGIHTEAAMYYQQHAEHAVRVDETAIAIQSFRRAYETAPDHVTPLERLADLHASNGDRAAAVAVLNEAMEQYERLKLASGIERCKAQLAQLDPANAAAPAKRPSAEAPVSPAVAEAAPPKPRPNGPPTLRSPAVPKLAEAASADPAGAEPGADGRMGRVLDLDSAPPSATDAELAGLGLSLGSASDTDAVVTNNDDDDEGEVDGRLELQPTSLGAPEPATEGGPVRALEDALARMSQVLSTSLGAERAAAADAAAANAAAAAAGVAPGVRQRPASPPADTAPPAPPAASDDAADAAPESARFNGRPGLRFDSAPEAPREGAELFWKLVPDAADTPEILAMIQDARERFLAGDSAGAVVLLVRAAQAYDAAGHLDHAARVHRTLREHLPPVRPALMVWFENCRRRGDRAEGAQVACELGDEAAGRSDLVTAREWFTRAQTLDPSNETAIARLRGLGVSVGGAPANGNGGEGAKTAVPSAPPRLRVPALARPGGPAASPAPHATPAQTTEQDPERIEITYGYGVDEGLDLSGLVEAFRREVQPHVSGDAQSQYALGVSYLEMGLVDQAIEALRAAGEDASLKGPVCELIGRCHMDHGRFEEAASEFRTALQQPGVAGESALKIRFELGLALEAAGRLDEGLAEFDRVYAAHPNFPDVALKIRSLRRALETD